MGPHSFEGSRTWAEAMARSPWMETLYRDKFPNFHAMFLLPSNNEWAQRGGIDRTIQLTSGKSVLVEEKFRAKDYSDFFLEYWSDVQRRRPGWIELDLACDFFAYIFVPSKRMFLMPYLSLRAAWLRNREYWMSNYETRSAVNEGWITEGVCVPIPVVLKAIADEGERRERPTRTPAEQSRLF